MALFYRWFHNSDTKQCEKFVYGGCGANANNFETKELCEIACMNKSQLWSQIIVVPFVCYTNENKDYKMFAYVFYTSYYLSMCNVAFLLSKYY